MNRSRANSDELSVKFYDSFEGHHHDLEEVLAHHRGNLLPMRKSWSVPHGILDHKEYCRNQLTMNGAKSKHVLRQFVKQERSKKLLKCNVESDDLVVNGLDETSTLLVGGASKESVGSTRSIRDLGICSVLSDYIFGNYINLLLLFMPFAYASHHLEWDPTYVFLLNFTAMIPLASLLGEFTEEVAAHTNQIIGGLINASFGNAVEVVVAIQALLAGQYRVVQASMLGSIMSNLLLVLGCCFFFGGMYSKEQKFNAAIANANMGLLLLSCIALVLPTPFADYFDVEDENVLSISRTAAVFLVIMYAQLLIYQLVTHKDMIADDDEKNVELPFWFAIMGLVVITCIIAVLSEYLVGSIEGFCSSSGISKSFVGIIILPVVGNAVEHITAVNVAMKNKMDLAVGVAIGSCTQISLFVAPLTVIVGWMVDRDMTLNFPKFEIVLFIMSVVVVANSVSDGRSDWLQGSLLVTTYVLIAVGFWYEKIVG